MSEIPAFQFSTPLELAPDLINIIEGAYRVEWMTCQGVITRCQFKMKYIFLVGDHLTQRP